MNKINDKIAVLLSNALSSMIMFWVISLLVIIPLFFNQPTNIVGWIQYAVSVFFQGAALPLLGYIAKVSGSRTDEIINKIELLTEQIAKNTTETEKTTEQINQRTEHIDIEIDQLVIK